MTPAAVIEVQVDEDEYLDEERQCNKRPITFLSNGGNLEIRHKTCGAKVDVIILKKI